MGHRICIVICNTDRDPTDGAGLKTFGMVILVDTDDNRIGLAERNRAHREGFLHRTYSLFVFDTEGRLFLRKELNTPGGSLWDNTCSNYPKGETDLSLCASDTLREETGMRCQPETIATFTYIEPVGNDIYINQYDHVLAGFTADIPISTEEARMIWKNATLPEIALEISYHPEEFTRHLRVIIHKFYDRLLLFSEK